MKRKQKKNVRQRGKKSHGWGIMNKHRGAGNRGGRGMAGTGKRAHAKKPSIVPSEYFGRHGFHSIFKKKYHVINVGQINSNFASFKALEKEGVIDLTAMGYSKLLSAGNVTQKFSVKINRASSDAVQKIEQAGGSVILPAKPVKSEVKQEEISEAKPQKSKAAKSAEKKAMREKKTEKPAKEN